MPERSYLAKYIKEYRKKNKLSQFEFGEECGIHSDTISLIEREQENLKLETLQKLAAYIGCTVADMLQGNAVYRVTESSLVDEEGVLHRVYGIEVIQRSTIPDIFTDYIEAQKFVDLCNRLEVSPIHIRDVIDDYLNK